MVDSIVIENLNDDDLQMLLDDIGSELKHRMKKRREQARLEIRKLAKESGVSVSFLTGKRKRRVKKGNS